MIQTQTVGIEKANVVEIAGNIRGDTLKGVADILAEAAAKGHQLVISCKQTAGTLDQRTAILAALCQKGIRVELHRVLPQLLQRGVVYLGRGIGAEGKTYTFVNGSSSDRPLYISATKLIEKGYAALEARLATA